MRKTALLSLSALTLGGTLLLCPSTQASPYTQNLTSPKNTSEVSTYHQSPAILKCLRIGDFRIRCDL